MSRVARLAEVIPFPKDPHGSSGNAGYGDDILDSIFEDPRLDSRIQEKIEGQLLALMYRAKLSGLREGEDSFDDIYLSELMPDSLPQKAFSQIQKFSRVKYLSGEISFVDEWED